MYIMKTMAQTTVCQVKGVTHIRLSHWTPPTNIWLLSLMELDTISIHSMSNDSAAVIQNTHPGGWLKLDGCQV